MRFSTSSIWFSSAVVFGLLLTGCGSPESGGGSADDVSGLGGDSSSDSGATTDSTVTTDSGATSDGSTPLNPTVEWASLKGRFVYDGKAPAPAPVDMQANANRAYCAPFNPVQETLVVNPQNDGLRDVVIYLRDETGKVHPDYEKAAADVVRIDNKQCRFEPHIVLLRTSQWLAIRNSDTVGHNTKIDTRDNPGQNPTVPANLSDDSIKFQFPEQEPRPAVVNCSIHGWMTAYLLVRDSPYFAVTDANGAFEMKNLPAGKWSMQVWHPAGYVQDVKLDGKSVKWSRGRVDVVIDDGDVDWGEVQVDPALFKQ